MPSRLQFRQRPRRLGSGLIRGVDARVLAELDQLMRVGAVTLGPGGRLRGAATFATGGGGLWPNEPGGMTPLVAGGYDFNSSVAAITLSGGAALRDATVPFITSGGASVSIGAGPKSPNGVATITIPTTVVPGNGAGSIVNTALSGKNARTVYFSFWLQMSSNWVGQSQGIIKMFMPRVTLSGVQNRVVVAPYGSGTGGLALRVAFQTCVTVDGANGLSTAYYAPISGTGTLVRGTWHRVEIVVVGNTAGVEDGAFQMWCDGTLTHSKAVQYDAAAVKWGQWDFNSTWGGTAGPPPPDSQFMAFDHMYVSWKV